MKSKTNLTTVEYVLPAHWASYLISRDASGIDPADRQAADNFISNHGLLAPVSCSDESEFRHRNDSGIPLACDCLTYFFLVPGKAEAL